MIFLKRTWVETAGTLSCPPSHQTVKTRLITTEGGGTKNTGNFPFRFQKGKGDSKGSFSLYLFASKMLRSFVNTLISSLS